jgi:hypothetical protein
MLIFIFYKSVTWNVHIIIHGLHERCVYGYCMLKFFWYVNLTDIMPGYHDTNLKFVITWMQAVKISCFVLR